MLVPLTITQSARPPRLCGRPNQRQVTTTPTSAASFASASGRRSRSFGTGRGRATVVGRCGWTLFLIAEGHRGAVAGSPVLGRADRDGGGAARGAQLPA